MVPRLCVGSGALALLVLCETWKSLCSSQSPVHPHRLPFHQMVLLEEGGFLRTFFLFFSIQPTVIEHLLCAKCCVGHWGWERADKSCPALAQCEGWDGSIAVGASGGAASLLTTTPPG